MFSQLIILMIYPIFTFLRMEVVSTIEIICFHLLGQLSKHMKQLVFRSRVILADQSYLARTIIATVLKHLQFWWFVENTATAPFTQIVCSLQYYTHLPKTSRYLGSQHTENLNFHNPMLSWISQCNAKVDHEAKLSITHDNRELFDHFNTQYSELCKQRQALHEIAQFQISCAHKVFLSSAKQLDMLDRSRDSTIFAEGFIPSCNLYN